MILVNGTKVDAKRFPDKTPLLSIEPEDFLYDIEWKYDGDEELFLLWSITKHLRDRTEQTDNVMFHLIMPYVPNARMDRVKNENEVFTLKWFADFINQLHFDCVSILDPHSNVSAALFDHVEVCHPASFISEAYSDIESRGVSMDNLILCYPDEGSSKRYCDIIGSDYVFCVKHRDWVTGKIEGLELINPSKVSGRNVLIVDDICFRGGTFYYTAQALKNAGAEKIFLYVTHCEDTILDGEVLTSGLIEHVYTTDSIFRKNHDKITVFKC